MPPTSTSNPFRAFLAGPAPDPFPGAAPASRAAGEFTPVPPPKAGRRWKGPVRAAAAGVVGLVLGLLLATSDRTGLAELRVVESDLAAARAELDDATARVESAEAEVDALTQQVAVGEEAVTAARTATEAAAAQEADLAARATDLAARESAVAAAEASAAAAAERAAAVVPAPIAPLVGAAPSGSASGSVVYGNCSEARAAGAAPVRIGEPGYSTRLDRDGDGVGCEG